MAEHPGRPPSPVQARSPPNPHTETPTHRYSKEARRLNSHKKRVLNRVKLRHSGSVSEKDMMKSRLSGAWLIAGSLLVFCGPASAQIAVEVNGNPVRFGAVQP